MLNTSLNYQYQKDVRSHERARNMRLKSKNRKRGGYHCNCSYCNGIAEVMQAKALMERYCREECKSSHRTVDSGGPLDVTNLGCDDRCCWESNDYSPPTKRSSLDFEGLVNNARVVTVKRKGAAKDFVVIDAVPRVVMLDDDEDSDPFGEDWEVVTDGVSRPRTYAAAVEM